MKKISFAAGSALTLALAFAGVAGAQSPSASPAVGSGDITSAAHPAHIHTGTCAALGDVVAPLDDVALVDGSDRIGSSSTRVDLTLKQILAAPHAIMAHASAEDLGTYIACADLTGTQGKRLLVVALDEQNASGFRGVAFLRTDNDKTVVDLALTAPDTGVGPMSPTSSFDPAASMAPMASMAPAASTTP